MVEKFTKWFVAVSVIIWIIVDIVLAIKWGAYATESVIISNWAIRLGTIPFACGFLCGHWFVNVPEEYWIRPRAAISVPVVAVLGASVDYGMYVTQTLYPWWATALMVPLGIVLGALLWTMPRKTNKVLDLPQ